MSSSEKWGAATSLCGYEPLRVMERQERIMAGARVFGRLLQLRVSAADVQRTYQVISELFWLMLAITEGQPERTGDPHLQENA